MFELIRLFIPPFWCIPPYLLFWVIPHDQLFYIAVHFRAFFIQEYVANSLVPAFRILFLIGCPFPYLFFRPLDPFETVKTTFILYFYFLSFASFIESFILCLTFYLCFISSYICFEVDEFII